MQRLCVCSTHLTSILAEEQRILEEQARLEEEARLAAEREERKRLREEERIRFLGITGRLNQELAIKIFDLDCWKIEHLKEIQVNILKHNSNDNNNNNNNSNNDNSSNKLFLLNKPTLIFQQHYYHGNSGILVHTIYN